MPDLPVPLRPHPAHPCDAVQQVSFDAVRDAAGLALQYVVCGELSRLSLPTGSGRTRRDELWKHTCFEVFLGKDGAEDYLEFNFAPDGDWAAYTFRGYRNGGSALDCAPPQIETTVSEDRLAISVRVPALPSEFASGQIRLGPSAIVETQDGTLSYWALHQPPEAPDFHTPNNFQISLD